jgi:hypothetical protein
MLSNSDNFLKSANFLEALVRHANSISVIVFKSFNLTSLTIDLTLYDTQVLSQLIKFFGSLREALMCFSDADQNLFLLVLTINLIIKFYFNDKNILRIFVLIS